MGSFIYLPLDQFELRVLPLGLIVRPWFDQRRLHRRMVLSNTGCKSGHQARLCIRQPLIQTFVFPALDQAMEAIEQISHGAQFHGS
jgi:hypothetical protein